MRTEALRAIAKMSAEDISARLLTVSDFVEKSDGERKVLVDYWTKWLEKPTAIVINASELSESERKQFMIKDNASFGQWDFDALSNKWDEAKLGDWGLDVWNAHPTAFVPMGTTPSSAHHSPSMPDESEDDKDGDISLDGLFDDSIQAPSSKKKKMVCPHCGRNIYETESADTDEKVDSDI